jgi:WD40 repeat protein
VGCGVESVAFAPDGQMVLSGSDDGTLRLWDVATGETLQVLEAHAKDVGSGVSILNVAFAPDGTRFVSGGADDIVRVWGILSK